MPDDVAVPTGYDKAGTISGIKVVVWVALILFAIGAAPSLIGDSTEFSLQPAILPVKITWGGGTVKIEGETGLITPIGRLEMNANVPLPRLSGTSFYVILRDKKAAKEHVYKVDSGTGTFHAVVNGTTDIQVDDQRVTIEVVEGTVKTVEFRRSAPASSAAGSSIGDKWRRYWRTFHSPFSWSRWAYDDSTMSSWPPFGFAWFLIRLVAAMILGVLDFLLLIVCFTAAVAFVFAGTVAVNITYGVAVLLGILFAITVRAAVS